MLDIELTPEKSISTDKFQIVLGMPINQVIQILQTNCETIKTVQLIYNDKNPLSCDYMINLINNGIILYFDSTNQRLRMIEICDLKKLKIRFSGKNNPSAIVPTIDQINEIFGITHPGHYDNQSNVFLLQFPGLHFTFNIDYPAESRVTHGIQSLHYNNARQAPSVSKISIYVGNKRETAIPPEIPFICLNKDVFANKITVLRDGKTTKGLQLNLFMQGAEKAYQFDNREYLDVEVLFDDTCQDVLSTIGTPSNVFFKSEELSKLYNNENLLAQALSQSNNNQFDYFYNYTTLGLDILFNADTHRISKFVLHTNYPCHYNFHSYYMCCYEIPLTISDSTQHLIVTPSTKWERIQEYLNIKTQPAILHRSSTTNSVNPFGPTFCYFHEDLIFEVMANGHIASITLFNQS